MDVVDAFRRPSRLDDEVVLSALGLVTALATRTLGLTPHLVQMMGALAMFDRYLIEMATGEGKTLTAALASALFGWSGRPCHVLTVNDYLAARDADGMRPLYGACGLSVAYVGDGMKPHHRREAYRADVVYTTSSQLLADFLRDRIELGELADSSRRLIRHMLEPDARDGLVLRGIDTVLVDEADSILIDEAVTPLIIAAPTENPSRLEAALAAEEIARSLVPGTHYEVDRPFRDLHLSRDGLAAIAVSASRLRGVWRGPARREELVRQALTAREFHRRDQHYVVQDGKIVIVDDFTGRLMPDRTWSHGLHQAVEAHEGVALTNPTETLARMSFQRFFRLFRRTCGMTGTAREVAAELWHIYELPVVSIPTHRPCRRRMLADRVFADEAAKLDAIVADTAACHAAGRPVLCGTRSVAASEELAARLEALGLPFEVLHAKRHAEEARIVGRAGQPGRITIATNMAGRGTDIQLGPGIAELGGLHVIATERNESSRIDRQLFGRCARQGDPGSSQAYVSPEDELVRRFVPDAARALLARIHRSRLPGRDRLVSAAVAYTQRTAQALAYRQREQVLRSDTRLDESLSFAGRTNGI